MGELGTLLSSLKQLHFNRKGITPHVPGSAPVRDIRTSEWTASNTRHSYRHVDAFVVMSKRQNDEADLMRAAVLWWPAVCTNGQDRCAHFQSSLCRR